METSDVKLARVTRTDLDELLHANQESRDYHGRWVQPFTTASGFEEWYSAQTTGASVGLLARDTESGQIVGVTNLSQIFYKWFQNAYLSYWGVVSFAGTGRMSQAVELTTRYAFEELGLHRLEANIQPVMCVQSRWSNVSDFGKRGSPRNTCRSPGSGAITSAGHFWPMSVNQRAVPLNIEADCPMICFSPSLSTPSASASPPRPSVRPSTAHALCPCRR